MTISPFFQEELQLVDAGRSFTFAIDAGYGANEWSVSNLVVTAGSDSSAEHGASEAMYQMGFRFFTPHITVRPATIPAGGVNLPKQQFVMPYCKTFLNYSFGGGDVGDPLQESFDRWTALNCFNDQRRPVGHTWRSVILDNSAFYDANPDHYTTHGPSGGGRSFVLNDPTIRAANLQKCVEYLRPRINEFDRASFDCDDGDSHDSDTVFSFANDVVAELRATTHPNAKLGLYAYAGHRAPASFQCPHLYVQVALGFNDLGIGYPALVDGWLQVCPEVTLRGYGEIAAQQGFLPYYSGISRSNFFNSVYPLYIASGADGLNMETSANWAKGIVPHYQMIRYCRYGISTYDEVRDDVVAKAYGGDSAASEVFDLLGDTTKSLNGFALKDLADAIDRMQPGIRKTELQQYMTVCEEHLSLTNDRVTGGAFGDLGASDDEGKYFTALEKNLRRVWGMAPSGAMHGYAYVRQMANANVGNNGRGDLQVGSNANWQRHPAAPSVADFTRNKAQIDNRFTRASEFGYDSLDDLVVVDVAPVGSAASNLSDTDHFHTLGKATFVVAGPSTVNVFYDDQPYFNETPEGNITEYGAGFHEFSITKNAVTSFSGGILFLKAFPAVRMDPSAEPVPGQRWAYIPKISKGRLDLYSRTRVTIYDEMGRHDINKQPIQNVTSGVVRVDNTNTRGAHSFITACPFISPRHDKMLMPLALAKREFPSLLIGGM